MILKEVTPKGIHPLMCVLLVLVELISVIIRPISLAVRMFANLVMGHIMIAGLNFVTAYTLMWVISLVWNKYSVVILPILI